MSTRAAGPVTGRAALQLLAVLPLNGQPMGLAVAATAAGLTPSQAADAATWLDLGGLCWTTSRLGQRRIQLRPAGVTARLRLVAPDGTGAQGTSA